MGQRLPSAGAVLAEEMAMVRIIESCARTHESGPIARVPQRESVAPADSLRFFEVTSDSVVATLVMEYEQSHRSVQVHWGDGQVEEIDLLTPRTPAGPQGSLRLQHVYDIEDFLSQVTVMTITRDAAGGRTVNADVVRVRPRYFILQEPVQVELAELGQQIFEGYTHEFDIGQEVFQRGRGELASRTWRLEVEIGGFREGSIGPWIYELSDSALTLQMDWEDEPVAYAFDVKEDDGVLGDIKAVWEVLTDFPVEFDTSSHILPELHPRMFPRTRHSRVTWRLGHEVLDGRVDVLVTFDASLEVPLDRGLVSRR